MRSRLFDMKNDNFALTSSIKSELQYGDESLLSNVQITILMPIFKHCNFLRQSLESALSQLTNYKYCILIVDNDSENEYHNLDIIREISSPQIVYYRNQRNLGLVGNWNRVVFLAKSHYITFLHDDDKLQPDTIQYLLEQSQQYPGKALIGQYEVIDKDNIIILEREKSDDTFHITLVDLLKGNITGNGVGSLFEREKLMELGGFSDEFMPCLDYALYSKYVQSYGAVFCKKILSYNRLADNFSFECNYKIADADFIIKSNIIPYITFPSFLLFYYIKILKKRQLLLIHKTYLSTESYNGSHVKWWENYYVSFLNIIFSKFFNS